jgi:hypothetical protein
MLQSFLVVDEDLLREQLEILSRRATWKSPAALPVE